MAPIRGLPDNSLLHRPYEFKNTLEIYALIALIHGLITYALLLAVIPRHKKGTSPKVGVAESANKKLRRVGLG